MFLRVYIYSREDGSSLSLLADLVVITGCSAVVRVLRVDELGLLWPSLLPRDRQLSDNKHQQWQREEVVEVVGAVGGAIIEGEKEEIDRAEAQKHLNGSCAENFDPEASR